MRRYLEGLNTLRAIAALVVVIAHVELFKHDRGIPSAFDANIRRLPDAHLGVVLFFVLSGFLITYLLIGERKASGTISLRKFYFRRILRIWPLYYLILFVSFLLHPGGIGLGEWLLSLFGAPNIGAALHMEWTPGPHIWSIGVEEQFYLVWPWVLLALPMKRVASALITFMVGFTFLPFVLDFINSRTVQAPGLYYFSSSFFYGAKFNSMAFGSLLGYLFATDHRALRILVSPIMAAVTIAASCILWFGAYRAAHFDDELYSLLFGLVILNIAANPKLGARLEFAPMVFLGRISYGIYMYHWIILILVFDHMPRWASAGLLSSDPALYMMVMLLTIGASWLSFITIERYFIRKKHQFDVAI